MHFRLQRELSLGFDIMVILFFTRRNFKNFLMKNKINQLSAAYSVALEDETAIFSNFSREDYTKMREKIRSMVLSTDMSIHFQDLAKLKGRLAY